MFLTTQLHLPNNSDKICIVYNVFVQNKINYLNLAASDQSWIWVFHQSSHLT